MQTQRDLIGPLPTECQEHWLEHLVNVSLATVELLGIVDSFKSS
jgi:hypothetical protein